MCSAPKIFAQTTTAASNDAPVPQPGQYPFGDWGGERTALAEKGFTFDFFYVADLQANPIGGPEQTQVG